MLSFVCRESCELLTSNENEASVDSIPIHDLCSSQKKSDTQCTASETVIVRSPDTYIHIFVLLLSFSDTIGKKIFFDTGTAINRRQVNIPELSASLPKQMRDAIVGMHAFTGYDSSSCFAGKGKLKALKLLQDDRNLLETFARFGALELIAPSDQGKKEAFVYQLYEKKSNSYTSVDKARYGKIKQSFKGKKAYCHIQMEWILTKSLHAKTYYCYIPRVQTIRPKCVENQMSVFQIRVFPNQREMGGAVQLIW